MKPDGFVELTVTDHANTLHRIGSPDYPEMHQVTVPQDSADGWEECPVPAYSQAEYKAKATELIRERYPADEEFALHRKMIKAMLKRLAVILDEAGADNDSLHATPSVVAEFDVYNQFAEQSKCRAKELLTATNEEE